MKRHLALLCFVLPFCIQAKNLLEESWSQLKKGDIYAEHIQEQLKPGTYAALLKELPATPGEKMLFQVELRTPAPLVQGVYRMQIAFFDVRGGLVALNTSAQSIKNSPQWSKLRYVFRVPEKSAHMQLRLVHNAIGTVQIRSIDLLTPEKGSFIDYQLPDYAGTIEEMKILHDWSLKTSGSAPPSAWLDYNDKPHNARFSVCFARDNQSDDKEFAWVESIVEDSRPAPAPLRPIEKVTLSLKTFHANGENLKLFVRFSEPHTGWGKMKNHHVAELPLKPSSGWSSIELPADAFRPVAGNWGKADWNNVDGMYFYLAFSGKGELGVKLADITIHYKDKTQGKPFQAWKDPFWYFPHLASDEKYDLAMPPRAAVHGSGIYLLESKEGIAHFQYLQNLLPSFGIQSNVYLRNLLATRPVLKKSGMGAGYQNASPYLWQAAVERDALAVPLDSYTMLNERHHKMDYTSERWNEIWKEVANRFGKYGIPEYQTIDSNFRVVPAQIDRHINDILNEKDGGILLSDGKTIHFWDYFQSYTGKIWTPQELGYTSWSEHRTEPTNLYAFSTSSAIQRKKGYLDMAIRHYAFVRFENGAAREFARNKVRFILMNNGDDWRNGNDAVWNIRSLIHGGFVDENYFYHPKTCLKAFHLGLQNKIAFDGKDVHHRLIGESGKGGHGPIYWDPEFSYAALFAICAATRYNSFEMDWPSEGLLKNAPSFNTYHYNRFRDYLFKNLAYSSATYERPLHPLIPMDRVISLQESRSMYAGPHSRKMSMAAENFSLPVSRLFPTLYDEKHLKKCSLLINDCYALPEGMAEKLIQFIKNSPHRTLLLHGVSAGRKIDGTLWSEAFGWNQSTLNAPQQFQEYLGTLTFRNGRTYASKPGKVIFSDKTGPVLSYYSVTPDSGIYFYAYLPGADPNRDYRILKAIMSRRNIPCPVISEGNNLYVRSYTDGSHCIFTAFDKKSIDEYKWVYSATENGCYPWRKAGLSSTETVHAPSGNFILFHVLTGKKEPVSIGTDHKLPLTLEGVTAEVFHLVPPEDKATLEMLQALYLKMQKYPPRDNK